MYPDVNFTVAYLRGGQVESATTFRIVFSDTPNVKDRASATIDCIKQYLPH